MTAPCDEHGNAQLTRRTTIAGRNWQELIVTVLLVVAALATSWSSYQATRWNGEQAAASGRTNGIRILAARADGLARSQTQVDVATFIAWADADQQGEKKVADFYVDRFRPEFQPAFDAWMADPTPDERRRTAHAVRHGRVPGRREGRGREARRRGRGVGRRGATDIQRSSNYVLTVVLYAVVLFFAGMSTRLRDRRLRWVMTIAGCLVLLAALGWVATFPVSLAV